MVRAAGPDRADRVHRLFDEPPRDLSEASVPALQWRPVPAQARAGMRQLGALDARNELRRSAGCALLDALGRRGCAGLPTAAEPGGDPRGVREPADWLAYGLDQLDLMMRYVLVAGDGAYAEGPFYYRYTSQNLLPFWRAWAKRAFPACSWRRAKAW